MNSTILDRFELPRADAATYKFPLLGSPVPVTVITVSYLLFVLKLGPMFMRDRKPYNLKTTIMIYNICQVIYNSVVFALACYHVLINPVYDLWCIETLRDDNPRKQVERYLTYAFFLNKIFDLMDTIFFVLRKSFKQITVLHVYHHAMMVYFVYWVVRLYGFGGQYVNLGVCNCFVHAIMYFYYLMSGIRPDMKSSLSWKKYITIAQITQFGLYLVQSFMVLIFNPGCTFPLVLQIQQILQAVSMIVMFSQFYYQAYIKPKPKQQ